MRDRQPIRRDWRHSIGGVLLTALTLALLGWAWWTAGIADGGRTRRERRLSLFTPTPPPPSLPPPRPVPLRIPARRLAVPRQPAAVATPPAAPSPSPSPVPPRPIVSAPQPLLPLSASPVPVATPIAPPPVAGTGAATGAGGAGGPGDVSTRAPADWIVFPADLDRYWPAEALRRRLSGRAVIRCRVRLSTRVHHCRPMTETPPHSGFAQATIAASPTYRVRPAQIDGKPVDDAWVVITVDWTLHLAPAPAAPSAPK